MSEPVQLGEVLPAVMRDLQKRMLSTQSLTSDVRSLIVLCRRPNNGCHSERSEESQLLKPDASPFGSARQFVLPYIDTRMLRPP